MKDKFNRTKWAYLLVPCTGNLLASRRPGHGLYVNASPFRLMTRGFPICSPFALRDRFISEPRAGNESTHTLRLDSRSSFVLATGWSGRIPALEHTSLLPTRQVFFCPARMLLFSVPSIAAPFMCQTYPVHDRVLFLLATREPRILSGLQRWRSVPM